MTRKLPKNPIKRRREEKRVAKLHRDGRIVRGVELPRGALPADPDAQQHGGGYSVKFYYRDLEYVCAGCGSQEVWTAEQQKRYFEVQKGNIYNQPKWCQQCHAQRMHDKEQADECSGRRNARGRRGSR